MKTLFPPAAAGHEPYVSNCCCYMVKIKQQYHYTKIYIE